MPSFGRVLAGLLAGVLLGSLVAAILYVTLHPRSGVPGKLGAWDLDLYFLAIPVGGSVGGLAGVLLSMRGK